MGVMVDMQSQEEYTKMLELQVMKLTEELEKKEEEYTKMLELQVMKMTEEEEKYTKMLKLQVMKLTEELEKKEEEVRRTMSNYLCGVLSDEMCRMIDLHMQGNIAIIELAPAIINEAANMDEEEPVRRPMFDSIYWASVCVGCAKWTSRPGISVFSAAPGRFQKLTRYACCLRTFIRH